MRHVRFRVLVACLPMVVALAACSQQSAAPAAAAAPAPAAAPVQPSIARGKVLVDASGCHDCHTPKKLGPNGPELDMTRLLSGHPEGMKVTTQFKPAPGSPWTVATNYALTAWSGPWGITYAANLTPDPNTGLRVASGRSAVHQGNQNRKAHGHVARHPAADAVAGFRAVQRRGSERHLELLQGTIPRDQQSRRRLPRSADGDVEGEVGGSMIPADTHDN